MVKPESIRKRWKNHELAVAKYFGTVRNIHGRGPGGDTGTDVVVSMREWLSVEQYELVRAGIPEYVYVECKYTYGNTNRIHTIMNKYRNDGYTLVTLWQNYVLCYLYDFEYVFVEIMGSSYCGNYDKARNRAGLADFLQSYEVRHHPGKVPGYVRAWWEQARRQVTKRALLKDGKSCVPVVCVGNSSKRKVVLFNKEIVL